MGPLELPVIRGPRGRGRGHTAAEQHHRAALTIAERLAAADPANAAYQRDLAYVRQRLAALLDPGHTP
jgi:hypothetical protein